MYDTKLPWRDDDGPGHGIRVGIGVDGVQVAPLNPGMRRTGTGQHAWRRDQRRPGGCPDGGRAGSPKGMPIGARSDSMRIAADRLDDAVILNSDNVSRHAISDADLEDPF